MNKKLLYLLEKMTPLQHIMYCKDITDASMRIILLNKTDDDKIESFIWAATYVLDKF